jgi:hypothetical protein
VGKNPLLGERQIGKKIWGQKNECSGICTPLSRTAIFLPFDFFAFLVVVRLRRTVAPELLWRVLKIPRINVLKRSVACRHHAGVSGPLSLRASRRR